MLARRFAWTTLAAAMMLAACGGERERGPSGAGSGGTRAEAGTGGAGEEPEACMVTALGPCVSSALDEAAECLGAGRVGVFTADRMACNFSDVDAMVQFSEPVGRGSPGSRLDFDLRVGDSLCLRYSETDAEAPYAKRYELVTASHSVVYLHGFERQLECDRERYDYAASDLSLCSSSAMLEVPVPTITELADAVAFDFARTNRISRVFVCNPP